MDLLSLESHYNNLARDIAGEWWRHIECDSDVDYAFTVKTMDVYCRDHADNILAKLDANLRRAGCGGITCEFLAARLAATLRQTAAERRKCIL